MEKQFVLVLILIEIVGLMGMGIAQLDSTSVTASSFDARDGGHTPENTLDGDYSTRWSAEGDGAWIRYDLEKPMMIDDINLAFYEGDMRVQFFRIEVSNDSHNWSEVFTGESSGDTNSLQDFSIEDTATRYVQIVGQGNTENEWNSLTEVEIHTT